MRLVLYVPSVLRDQIQADARRRGEAAGLEVSLPDATKALLREALARAGADADEGVTADVAMNLQTCAKKLRERGALTAEGAASLSRALDELAGRLGGVVVSGDAVDEDEGKAG